MSRKKIVYVMASGIVLGASYKMVYSAGMFVGRILAVNELVTNFDEVLPGTKKEFIKNVINEKVDKIFENKKS